MHRIQVPEKGQGHRPIITLVARERHRDCKLKANLSNLVRTLSKVKKKGEGCSSVIKYLACARPWVHSSVLKKGREEGRQGRGKGTGH